MTFFILMLTKNDVTVQDAPEIFEEIKDTGVRHIGFKDIGLPMNALRGLVQKMRGHGMETYLEVVSESEEENLRSVKKALDLGVDNLIGGTFVEQSLRLLNGKGPNYMPYVGKIVGHPCLLRGSIEEIVADAKEKEALGVDGINLLAYRYDGDVEKLTTSILSALHVPVIVAGSIDSFEKIRHMVKMHVNGFTIGGAVLDKRLVPNGSLSDQVEAVLKETGELR